MITLSGSDSGSRRAVRVDDVIEITLVENATTGYRWQLEIDTAMLRVADDSSEPGGPMRGAPGRRVFTLEALASGATTIRARNVRSWQPDRAAEEFVVQLDIAP
jgi:predicted secreted protein